MSRKNETERKLYTMIIVTKDCNYQICSGISKNKSIETDLF